jgi:hypothetical protein
MMEWISKLPDGAMALLMAGGAWFGFNYAVLGERAMEREVHAPITKACVADLDGRQGGRVVPRSGIGELLGLPQLDELEAQIVQRSMPRALSEAELLAVCGCALGASAEARRFDYALHTASFRLWPIGDVSALRSRVIATATSSLCGS